MSNSTLNESIVEDAALEWFLLRQGYGGQVGEQTGIAPTLMPAISQREMEKEREAIRRLNLTIPEEARAAIKRYLRARFKRRLNP